MDFDDDDALRPRALERSLALAREQRLEVAYGPYALHWPDGRVETMSTFPPAFGRFCTQTALVHSGLGFFERNAAAGEFSDPNDWFRLEAMLRAGVRFGMHDEIVMDYFPSMRGRSELRRPGGPRARRGGRSPRGPVRRAAGAPTTRDARARGGSPVRPRSRRRGSCGEQRGGRSQARVLRVEQVGRDRQRGVGQTADAANAQPQPGVRGGPGDALGGIAHEHTEAIGQPELEGEVVDPDVQFVEAGDPDHGFDVRDGFPRLQQADDTRATRDERGEPRDLRRAAEHRQHQHLGARRERGLDLALRARVDRIDACEQPPVGDRRPQRARSSTLCGEIQVPRPAWRSAFPTRSRSTPMRSTPAASALRAVMGSFVQSVRTM